jgi:hypothetical protein
MIVHPSMFGPSAAGNIGDGADSRNGAGTISTGCQRERGTVSLQLHS